MMNTLFDKQTIWKDPFSEPALPPSHYHPSLQKSLSSKNKQTKIQATAEDHTKQKKKTECEQVSPKAKTFLDKGHSYIRRELPTHDTPSPGNNSSKFDESWPSSERPSTVGSPDDFSPHVVNNNQTSGASPKLAYSKVLPPKNDALSLAASLAEGRQSTVNSTLTNVVQRSMKGHPSSNQSATRRSSQSTERKIPVGSTIAKYIERFRYGEPSSREDRKREKNSGKAQDFWWLQSSISPSSAIQTSTPTDVDFQSDSSLFLAPDSTDRQTTDIQRRANALIDRSESSFSNETIVSSEPSNLPSQLHPPVLINRPANVPTEYSKRTLFPMQSGMHNSFKAAMRNTTPEDDILYQWRLRRKLEQARNKSTEWTRLISGPSSRSNPKSQCIAERSGQDVDSKLSEFRERLRHQEQVSALGLPHPPRNKTSLGVHDVNNSGNDPMPQTISTQTNGMLHDRPKLDPFHDGEPSSEANFPQVDGTRKDLPVTISSPKHPYPLKADQGVLPHLHMSCDIIPCHDVEHHEGTRGQEKTELQNACPVMNPLKQNLDYSDYGLPSFGEGKQRNERVAIDKNVHNIRKRDKTQRETLHRVEQEPEGEAAWTQERKNSVDEELEITIVNAARQPLQRCATASPISSTIGKVVSDRLFSTPQRSVSPCSSEHSLPSMHSSTNQKDSGNTVLHDIEISDDNSSGEFSDDELLQVLRQKREVYEEELSEIDQRLAEFQD